MEEPDIQKDRKRRNTYFIIVFGIIAIIIYVLFFNVISDM